MSQVFLQIGSSIYSGWKSIRIQTGIEQVAGSFELTCADRWSIRGLPVPLLAGKDCQVFVDDTRVITGWLDDDSPGYSKRDHGLLLRGRDATGDLVDSAAITDGQGWSDWTLERMARDLCKPFGIRVSVARGTAKSARPSLDKPFESARVNPGETVFEVLSRAAQLRGCLLVADGLGGLLITAAGSRRASTVLKRGVNILAGSALNSHAERFHRYDVIGQSSEAGGDDASAAQQVLATAYDQAIRKGRRTVIQVSEDLPAEDAQLLADWTAANRLARGQSAVITVKGWLDGDAPWRHNSVVSIDDPLLRMKGDYLIASVSFTVDDREGQLAELEVAPPAAYVPSPLPEAA